MESIAKKGVPPEDKKPPIIQTRGICILKKEQTPGRITPEFLSMEFHMPWQVGGREIRDSQEGGLGWAWMG